MIEKAFKDLKSGYYYHIITANAEYIKANCYNQNSHLPQLQFSTGYFKELVKEGSIEFMKRDEIISNKLNYLGK